MTSWTNATDERGQVARSGVRAGNDGLGEVVHPQHIDPVINRSMLEVTDPRLLTYADRFWSVRWSRHGEPLETSEVITNPVCHITFESGHRDDGGPLVRHGVEMPASVVTTVWTDRFVVRLEGSGRAFGLRFRPGALAAVVGAPLAADQSLAVGDYFPDAAEIQRAVLAEPEDESRRTIVQDWLVDHLPAEPDADFLAVERLVERVREDDQIVRVEQIGQDAGQSVRAVQRLFRHYLGVPPKWVLMRCRLQDAAAALDRDPDTELADLATRLGWYDQSHFVRDFRRFLGVTPGQYAREASPGSGG